MKLELGKEDAEFLNDLLWEVWYAVARRRLPESVGDLSRALVDLKSVTRLRDNVRETMFAHRIMSVSQHPLVKMLEIKVRDEDRGEPVVRLP